MGKEVQIWRYAIPPKHSEGWGIFLLDSTGMFCAVTNYGNYAYKWTYHGRDDFREFVIELAGKSSGVDYIMGKLTPRGRQYDEVKSIREIEEHILSLRREGIYSKEFARKEWDCLQESDMDTEVAFYDWFSGTGLDIYAYDFTRYSWTPQHRMFVEKLMPRLGEALKAELGVE